MKYQNKAKTLPIKKDNYYIIIDFDKTITASKSLDSWMAIIDFSIYGEDCKKEIEKLNETYSPIELDYQIDKKEKEQYMIEWYQKSMDLLYQYGLTKTNLKKALEKEPLRLRKGAKEFFKTMNENKIPVIILSAGIGNAIEEFLKSQEIYFDNLHIISNFIQFESDNMQKFNGELLHSMNKTIEGKLPRNWQEEVNKKQYAILLRRLNRRHPV